MIVPLQVGQISLPILGRPARDPRLFAGGKFRLQLTGDFPGQVALDREYVD